MADSDKEETPALEGIRKDQENLLAEVQEIRESLFLQLDDPDYENLDCRELEDLETDLGALLKRGHRYKAKMLLEEAEAESKAEDSKQWKAFQLLVSQAKGTCRHLIATREVHGKIQTADRIISQLAKRRLENPHKDYSIPVRRISEKVTDLLETLEASTIPNDHLLRTRAMELEISLEDMEIVDMVLSTTEVKPSLKDKSEPPKMLAIAPPTFSGQQRDWQAFWTAFQDIHLCSKYSDTAKLAYLRQAQKDTPLYNQLCQSIANGDPYDKVVAGLKDQFDKPREVHKIYVENISKMQPVKPTRSSLMACATTLQSSIDGLARLKQVDANSVFTAMVEPLLPEKVKHQWEEETVSRKTVPSAEELIAFLRKRSSMPQYADKLPSITPAEKKPFKQQNRHKGSVHVASSSPAQPHSPPPEPRPSASSRNSGSKPRSQSFPPCRYTCPGCKEAHYAYACSMFKEKSASQRKDYVQQHSLCSNCLKPGHSQSECRSRYTCQVCEGKHNTMLHSSDQGNSTTTASGNVNAISATSSTSTFSKPKLMMTCEVVVTGPTGLSMPVRALLDSGADISSVTSKVANTLNLKHLKDTVAVATFGSSTEKIC